jgi:hypothetical protein
MIIVLQTGCGLHNLGVQRRERGIFLLFLHTNGAWFPAIPSRRSGVHTENLVFNQRDETKMKNVLRMAAGPASALMAVAFLSMSTPASAGDYCHTDTSGMRGCGYTTMEQCEASASGKGGAGCYRDPFLPEASNPKNALAQVKPKSAVHHAKPVNAQ